MSDNARLLALDAADPLADLRAEFHLPMHHGEPQVYLCGNSLGLQPKATRAALEQELDDWARLGVEGHFHAKHSWYETHLELRGSLARLAGAKPTEVAAMGSLTANLHMALTSFYRPTSSRFKVLMEAEMFPSDRYAMASHIELHDRTREGALIELSGDARGLISTDRIVDAIRQAGDSLALILWSGVNYYSGQRYDLDAIAEAAREVGASIGFDLAHAMGNVPLTLHETAPDFAVWCTYKYLNSGPGGVGGLFVHERHHGDASLHRLAGWWGNDPATRFTMPRTFVPQQSVDAWQVSNAPVLQIAALRASLGLFDSAPLDALRAKSLRMGSVLRALLHERLGDRVLLLTPEPSDERGCQLSIRVGDAARRVCDQLLARGVVCDFRAPDVVRAAPTPLYNTFAELGRFTETLAAIYDEQPWERPAC